MLIRPPPRLLSHPRSPRRTGGVAVLEIITSDVQGDSVAVTLIGVVERRGRVQLGVTGGGIKEVLVGMTDRVKVLKDNGALIYITTKQACFVKNLGLAYKSFI